jgi:glycine/D-amino acid oxidase-like deaminating enzyme
MFQFNDQMPVTFNDDLPDRVDVVIIGAGVIGIVTAWYLRQQGLAVLVCDKGRVAAEQSSRNWGYVRVTARDPAEVPIAQESLRCWDEISAELDDDTGFTRQGILLLAETESEMADFEAWMKVAAEHGVDTQIFTADDAKKYIVGLGDGWRGGIVTPSDARAEPFKAVPAIARGLQKRGGLVRENCAVRTLDMAAGEVAGVVTEHGTVRARAVVCAAGAWSNLFLANLGVRFPQLTVRGTVVRTAATAEIYPGAAGFKDVYLRRRQDGGYTVASEWFDHTIRANSFRYFRDFLPTLATGSYIGLGVGRDVTQRGVAGWQWSGADTSPFESNRVLNPAPSKKGIRMIRQHLANRLPQLADVEFAESWAGMIDATPDIVPVMDQLESHPGLFLASGFSGHGFGIGPGAGKVMANLITGRATGFDLDRFRFSRFADGSKRRPGPAI